MKPDTEKVLSILAMHENDPSNLIAICRMCRRNTIT